MNFFKVMMPGFHQKLKLPEIISKELERHKSEKVILESRLGRWKISMCRNLENDLICLSEGWSEFVERHSLSIGYFLVFEHTCDLHFNVSVFDSSACEKVYDEKKEKKKKGKGKEKEKKEGATKAVNRTNPPKNTSIAEIIEEAEKKSRCFVKTMVPNHATKGATVCIPKKFMKRYGLGQQTIATLRDPKGRSWPVTLSFNSGIRMRTRMCGGGWRHFYESNTLKDGDICVFKLKRRLLTPTTIFFDVQIFPAP